MVRIVLRGAAMLAVVATSWVAGLAAAALSARWVASIGVLVVVALGAALLVSGTGTWLITRQRRLTAGVAAAGVIGLLLGGVLVFRPLPSAPVEAAAAPGDVQFWELPTGS